MKKLIQTILSKHKLAFFALIILVSGCTSFFTMQMLQSQLELVVDSRFKQAYSALGGEEVFGEPLSGVIVHGNVEYQHYLNASIMRDLNRPEGSQVILVPIGTHLNYHDPLPAALAEDITSIDGYISIPEFATFYQEHGGATTFGTALTNVRFNREFNRLEQYFTYFGLYLGAGADEAQFLPYGAFACGSRCTGEVPPNAQVFPAGLIPEPFYSEYRSIGSSMTGRLLNGPIQTSDGGMEMIFENLVMAISSPDSSKVDIKHISYWLGYETEAPVSNLNDPRVYFYHLENGLGHNIVLPFVEAITRHGGFPVSGEPVMEGFKLREGVYRQCFTRICLDYFVNAPANLNVVPVALGREYFEQKYSSEIQPTLIPAGKDFDLIAYALNPVLLNNQEQIIQASFHHGTSPQVAVEMTLTLNLPNGKQRVYAFPATDENGETKVVIPPINDLPEGIVQMQVCLNNPSYQIPCIEQSYQVITP